MSFERLPGGTGIGAEAAIAPPESGSAGDGGARALRMQVLATEHWSLLASRSLAWGETFARTGMFLTTLSGAVVAIALVAQASNFGPEARLFALALLPIVLFVGLSTFFRLGASNYHDMLCVVGMNRIRAAYLQLVPDVAPFLVMSAHDDRRGIGISMGIDPGRPRALHILAGTPTVVIVLNSLLAGAIASLLAFQAGGGIDVSVVAGVLGFGLALAGHVEFARRAIRRTTSALPAAFPSPSMSPDPSLAQAESKREP
jgi:hypothetical protein